MTAAAPDGTGGKEDKLFAAETPGEPALPGFGMFPEDGGDLLQNQIAGDMAVFIINLFKMVKIKNDAAEGQSGPVFLLLFGQVLIEVITVVEAGQRVVQASSWVFGAGGYSPGPG